MKKYKLRFFIVCLAITLSNNGAEEQNKKCTSVKNNNSRTFLFIGPFFYLLQKIMFIIYEKVTLQSMLRFDFLPHCKSKKDIVRLGENKKFDEWHALFHACREYLPEDLNKRIAGLWMQLEDNKGFINCMQNILTKFVVINNNKENKPQEWKLPPYVAMTHDGQYYVGKEISSNSRYKYSINMYDVNQKCIKSFEDKEQFTLFKSKNVLLFYNNCGNADGNISIYDIDQDKIYKIRQGPGRIKAKVSFDENHIALVKDKKIIILDIKKLDDIIIFEYEMPNNVCCVAFSKNNKLFASASHIVGNNSTVTLWSFKNGQLIKLSSCSINQAMHPYRLELQFMRNDTCLMVTKASINGIFCIDLNIKNGLISETQKIDGAYCYYHIENGLISEAANTHNYDCYYEYDHYQNIEKKISDTIFAYSHGNNFIVTAHGKKIYKETLVRLQLVALSDNERNFAFRCYSGQMSILHFSKDKNGLVAYSSKNNCEKLEALDVEQFINFNKQSSMFLCSKAAVLYDLYGKKIRSWQQKSFKEAFFHPNGRAVIYDDKLYELYDEKTEIVVQNTFKNLTLDQYLLFRDISSQESRSPLKDSFILHKQLLLDPIMQS